MEAELQQQESEEDDGLPEGGWLPLNSRRVTTAYLQLLAQSLGLPTGMSADELRQQVEGKMLAMEHEPRNVQVVVQEQTRTELRLLMVDERGVFIDTEAVVRDVDGGQQESETLRTQMQQQMEEQAARLEESYRQLETMSNTLATTRERVEVLEQQMASEKQRAAEAQSQLESKRETIGDQKQLLQLQAELGTVKNKVKQLWQKNCQQLVDHDAVIASKEAEVMALKTELQQVRV